MDAGKGPRCVSFPKARRPVWSGTAGFVAMNCRGFVLYKDAFVELSIFSFQQTNSSLFAIGYDIGT